MPKSRLRSRALLHTLPITFTAQIQLRFRQTRILSLRGSILLLSKLASDTPDQASELIVLSSNSRLCARGHQKALVHSLRLSFHDRKTRDQFLEAANFAIEHARGGLDRYAICQELGRGASGVVYLVKRRTDMRSFAMKVISKAEALLSDWRTQNLVHERAALVEAAERGSAFIVRLVDAFESDAHLCFVTELAEHGDLKSVLSNIPGGRLPEGVARRLFAEILLALEESHRMGYLFRDLKLGNILLNKKGHIKLADFGLAKKMDIEYESSSLSSESESSTTDGVNDSFRLVGRTRTFVGTRRYMSPELFDGVARRKRGYGAPADVWALGVSLFMLLTGNFPYGNGVSSQNTVVMLDAINNEKLRFPEWIGEEAKSLLSGMLERDPLERMELRDIKVHAWMRGVEWGRVHHEAENDVAENIVQEELRRAGVASDEEETDTCDQSLRDYRMASSADRYSPRKHPFNMHSVRGEFANIELLGFRYHDSTFKSHSSQGRL